MSRHYFILSDVAEVMNRSLHTVRDDKQSGEFDPDDFKDVVRYMLNKGVNVEVKDD